MAIVPNKKTFQILCKVLSYHKLVTNAPLRTPNSRAMNMVPEPNPRLSGGERSAVHAKIVGEVIPVPIPNIAAETRYHVALVESPIKSVEILKIIIPTNKVSRLPYLSDKFPVNKRIPMVVET